MKVRAAEDHGVQLELVVQWSEGNSMLHSAPPVADVTADGEAEWAAPQPKVRTRLLVRADLHTRCKGLECGAVHAGWCHMAG